MTEASVVAVTGASSGIGRATALAFAGAGWRVACGARRTDRLVEVVEACTEAGSAAVAELLDVTSPESVSDFFRAVEDRFGRLDAVVCNAGISVPSSIEELDAHDLARIIDTNLVGATLCAQAGIRSFRASGTVGDIVFVSSDAVEKPYLHMLAYGASKVGLEYLATGLRGELAGTGIRITTLRLGPTVTDFGAGWETDPTVELMRVWKRHAVLPSRAVLQVDTPAALIVDVVTAPREVEHRLVSIGPTATEDAAAERRRDERTET